jgi:hypothetical protein
MILYLKEVKPREAIEKMRNNEVRSYSSDC